LSLTFQDYLNAVKDTAIQTRIKIEWLFPDETVNKEITSDLSQTNGNLTIDFKNGARRSIDLTLYNVDKTYLPSINTLWIGQKIKLWLGFQIGEETYYLPQGVFYITNPRAVSNFSEKTLQIQGIDKFGALDGTVGGEVDGVYQIPVGNNIYDAIKAILNLSRGNGYKIDVLDPILSSYYVGKTTTLPDGSTHQRLTTPYTLRAEKGKTYGDIILELADMLGAIVYYNEEGRLVIEPSQLDVDDNTKPSVWDFTTEEFEYLGSDCEFKFSDIYNRITVVGDQINGKTATYTLENNNLNSETCILRIGSRTKIIEDTAIYSDELAQERAKYEMKLTTIVQKAVGISVAPMYHLDVNKVITLTDDAYNFYKERFLINNINIPFSMGESLKVTATSVNSLLV
jgi:hypothetical protein